jgi:hypothetical protein
VYADFQKTAIRARLLALVANPHHACEKYGLVVAALRFETGINANANSGASHAERNRRCRMQSTWMVEPVFLLFSIFFEFM